MERISWDISGRDLRAEGIGKGLSVEASLPLNGFFLQRLPFELRLQIYHLLIPRKRVVQTSSPDLLMHWPYREVAHPLSQTSVQMIDAPDIYTHMNNGHSMPQSPKSAFVRRRNRNRNSIFLLSKRISVEALDVLYGENVYLCMFKRGGDTKLKETFTERNVQRIRYLVLIIESTGLSYTPRQAPAIDFWTSILPRLKGLRIVADPPSSAMLSHPIAGPFLREDLKRWIAWLRLFLECFAKHLSPDAVLEIDINDRAYTREIVDEFLANRYREVRCCFVGHLLFARGRVKSKSGFDWENHANTQGYD